MMGIDGFRWGAYFWLRGDRVVDGEGEVWVCGAPISAFGWFGTGAL